MLASIAEALYGGLCAAVAVSRGFGNTYQQASVIVIICNDVANGLSDMNFIFTWLAIYSILIFFG